MQCEYRTLKTIRAKRTSYLCKLHSLHPVVLGLLAVHSLAHLSCSVFHLCATEEERDGDIVGEFESGKKAGRQHKALRRLVASCCLNHALVHLRSFVL